MENLKSGTQLGPYGILEPIGQGGMGQVYKARDSRLDRTVAIKVAHEQFSERFDREARAVAALNHPNICTVHDVGPNYLVMELVEGPTLAEHLKAGSIPVEEALRIARQIADALEAAHEKEIVHRDLKPANVKVKPDGTVKVLDFGLAKIGSSSTSADQLPTMGGGATQTGMILGTAGYMSPEQARGQGADHRADIWAFGVILYEMLTGERLFDGETPSDSLAQVLTKEPDFNRVPARARRLVQACLEKDARKRLRDIGDAWRLLDETPAATAPTHPRSLLRKLSLVAAAALFLLGGATSYYYFRNSLEPAATIRFQIAEPGATQPMISPDGRWIVFIGADTAMYLRPLESVAARRLEGTDGAAGPFWSPDNRSIAFLSKGKLQRVDVAGGAPQILCNLPAFRGGTWNKNGVILVGGAQSGLYRVPDRGGEPILAATPDPSQKEASYSSPYFLPDQQHYLYSIAFSGAPSAVFLGSLDSKEHTQLLTPSSRVALTASGYLFFTRGQTLFARPFDAKNFNLAGTVLRVVDDVANSAGSNGEFSVSSHGVLAYRQGVGLTESQLVWLDRKGAPPEIVGMPNSYGNFDLSDDGKSLVVDVRDRAGAQNIFLMDLVTGVNEQITSNGRLNNNTPVLSPDEQVAFSSGNGQGADIYVQKIGGLKKEAVLISTPSLSIIQDWSPDGQYVAYIDGADTERRTLSAMPLFGERKAIPIVKIPGAANFGQAHFSFDGKWVAYVSSESGTPQIYVVSFPGGDKKRQISANGGGQPRWRRDGKELYYLNMDGKMMAVDVNLGATIEFKTARELFDGKVKLTPFATQYQVMPDGQRFLVKQRASEAFSPINVVVNWAASPQK